MGLSNIEIRRLAALSEGLNAWQSVLSLSQLLALITIARIPGLSVNDLADNLGLPQQTVSRHVAVLLGRYETLDAAGAGLLPFVRQEISASDPRRRALFLTEGGLAMLKAIVSDRPAITLSTAKSGKVQ